MHSASSGDFFLCAGKKFFAVENQDDDRPERCMSNPPRFDSVAFVRLLFARMRALQNCARGNPAASIR